MVTITLKKGGKEYFNLKNHAREKALRDAWYSMSDIPTCADKQFKIHTDKGKDLLLRIKEIQSVEFEASEYVKVSAADIH